MGTKILLSTLNSSYQHTAFGLRYLYANMKDLKEHTEIKEFTIKQSAKEIAENILHLNPQILGLGIYIWNAKQSLELVSILKKIKPDLIIVLGGPEVSFESDKQEIVHLADYVICGEADHEFYEVCKKILNEDPIQNKIIAMQLPQINEIALPYDYYTAEDIKNRYIYVEASRGCPYKCEYCLSSLDKQVRNFDLNILLREFEKLINKGARNFKFIDRTFNLSPRISTEILNFFLKKSDLGLFLHFEMVPDRLPEELKTIIKQFPKGSLQFEIGIQTWNPKIANLISRRNDYAKTIENIQFLSSETGTHLHTDLIIGLPDEDINSFATGFDQLANLGAHEIQVGMLKRLRGAPISRHEKNYGLIYQDFAPYQILQTNQISYFEMQKLSRFAKYWDLIGNSGNFNHLIHHMKQDAINRKSSFFWTFYKLSEFLSSRHGEGHSIALLSLLESVWLYFSDQTAHNLDDLKEILIKDYTGNTKRDIPSFLKNGSSHNIKEPKEKNLDQTSLSKSKNNTPKRQQRHIQ